MNPLFTQGTRRGPYHVLKDLENQDYCDKVLTPTHCFFALSDGMGSREKSRQGAEHMVGQVLAALQETFTPEAPRQEAEEVLLKSFLSARESLLLREDAQAHGCTFIAVVVTEAYWCALAVGDSFAVLGRGEGAALSFQKVEGPATSEYSNVTTAVTSEPLTYSLLGEDEALTFVALASDGLASISLSQGEPFPKFWKPVAALAAQGTFVVEDLFAMMERAEKLDDDSTLMVCALGAGEEE